MSDSDAFCAAFPKAYLAFHRRDGRRNELTNASRAVLTHLAASGPITIGEAARHLDRAQSVVSDIVTQLEGTGCWSASPTRTTGAAPWSGSRTPAAPGCATTPTCSTGRWSGGRWINWTTPPAAA